jgi:superkiller protein 8
MRIHNGKWTFRFCGTELTLTQSKQYLSQHTIDNGENSVHKSQPHTNFSIAHRIDIYSLAITSSQILSASGESSIKIHSTTSDDFPIAQVLKNAHKLGCHHITTSQNGERAVSVGFGGEANVWKFEDAIWKEEGQIKEATKAGELWAVALSVEGQYLAGTTYDGRINIWDLVDGRRKIREYETKGSFGMSIDLVCRSFFLPLYTNMVISVPGRPLYSLWTRVRRHLHLQQ